MQRFFLLAALVLPGLISRAATNESYNKLVKPFFSEHCEKCHGEKKKKGDLRLDTLGTDFESPAIAGHWMEIMERINSGDMPPEDEKRPRAEVIAKVADWITERLIEAEAARQSSDSEKVSFRRLTREEYANTVHDLLGVTFDATDPTGLPEDPDWHGFQRIGSVLTLSPAHVEKYMAAAEAVLSEALALEKEPKKEVTHWSAQDIRGSAKTYFKEYEQRGIADKIRVDLVPNNGALDSKDFTVKEGGDYIVRVQVSGLRPEGGRAPRLRLYDSGVSRLLFEQDIDTTEDKPALLEFRAHLPAGKHPIRIVNAVPGPNPEGRKSRSTGTPNTFTSIKARVPWQMKFTTDDYKPLVPFLLLDWIEWEGPVQESWPTPAYKRIFFKGKDVQDLAYAREILNRFAGRAWRRPATTEEVDRLVKVVEEAQKLGDNFESAVKTGLLTTLCSKNFVYLQEGNAKAPAARLNDWELASRLSYFLWSSMPDEALLEAARDGKLHEPAVVREQVRRMMKDPKAAKFADSFPRQWLQLNKVGMFAPDSKLYPEYDEYLEKSMIGETTGFFREVLEKNLSLREFLQSDWTLLNERLATHYGIEGVKGEPLQRVSLKPEDHRGGLLTQGSILSMTSDGTRHRPVHRGKWVLEAIVGKPPPPPPANVPAIEPPPPTAPKTTLRAKLEAHKSDANCAACHLKIDPLGLAFDNYDAIGRWRTEEVQRDGTGSNPKLDPSGELNDGRKFADANGLKQIMLTDIDKFDAACIEKLATYGMRRAPNFGDRAELKRLAEESKASGYKLGSLVESLASSELFQRR